MATQRIGVPQLNSRFLWPARLFWLVALAMVITLLAVNAPVNAIYARHEYTVQQAREAILALTSLQHFADGLVAVRWLSVLIYLAVALLIAWRKWTEPFALLVSAALVLLAWSFVMRGDRSTWHYPQLLQPIVPALSFLLEQLLVPNLLLLFFLFPNGRFVSRRHRWVAGVAIIASVLFISLEEFRPLPSHYLDGWAWPFWMYILLGSLLTGLAGQVHRYRKLATLAERQQLKWVIFGLAGLLATPLLAWPLEDLAGAWGALAAIIIDLATVTFLPLTIGFSVLRYRLWDIDLLLNRSLVYGGLTLLVTFVYVVVVGFMSLFTNSGDSVILSVLATGLIAILFSPLRQRLQTAVNRLMYGERDDPATVLTRLGQRLAETAVPGDTLPTLVETIAQTLKLPYVAITSGDDTIASTGAPLRRPLYHFPLIYQSQPIGRLQVAARAGGESFTPHEEQLLRNVARQAGPAVYAEKLTVQLQRSRERLVTTREEERRRLRRDLHDGLGPQLATLTVKVSAAQNLLSQNQAASERLLDEVKAEAQNALKEIRRVVDGLRPSALDQLGLVSALREFAAQNENGHLRITVHAPQQLPSLPAAVEVAAYRIATEAVTNAVRHARAQSCHLRLEVDGWLTLEIHDDGDGLPADYEPGVGLSSMRERALELRGSFDIQSGPGRGTILTVRLPLAASQ